MDALIDVGYFGVNSRLVYQHVSCDIPEGTYMHMINVYVRRYVHGVDH